MLKQEIKEQIVKIRTKWLLKNETADENYIVSDELPTVPIFRDCVG